MNQEPPLGIASGGLFFSRAGSGRRVILYALLISLILHLGAILSLLRLRVFDIGTDGASGQHAGAMVAQMSVATARVDGVKGDVGGAREMLSGVDHRRVPHGDKVPRTGRQRRVDATPRLNTGGGNILAEVPVGQSWPSEVIPAGNEGAAEFRLELARRAREFRRYPLEAKQNGWEGVAVVSILFPGQSLQQVVTLEHSSGHAVLDRHALEMVERASQLASAPISLLRNRFRLSIPIEFSLEE